MSLRKIIQDADLDARRTFLTGMARSMLGVGAAATFGPHAVAGALTGDARQDPKGQPPSSSWMALTGWTSRP